MPTLAGVMGRVSVPLVTPFYAPSEDVNFDALVKLIDLIITSQYADSLILTGTTGEFYTLSDEERVEIWKIAKKTVAGRIPMVAGAGAASTRTTIRLCQEAEKIGCAWAPVRDVSGKMVAAISVSGPTVRISEDGLRKLAGQAKASAEAISQAFVAATASV